MAARSALISDMNCVCSERIAAILDGVGDGTDAIAVDMPKSRVTIITFIRTPLLCFDTSKIPRVRPTDRIGVREIDCKPRRRSGEENPLND